MPAAVALLDPPPGRLRSTLCRVVVAAQVSNCDPFYICTDLEIVSYRGRKDDESLDTNLNSNLYEICVITYIPL